MNENCPSSRTGLAGTPVILCVLAALSWTGTALGQGGADTWQKRVTTYAWLPDLSGKTQFPTGGAGPDIEVDASDIVSVLNFTLMGTIDLRKGSWGMFSDVLYMDLGNTKDIGRQFSLGLAQIPADVSLGVRFDLKSWVWTVAGTYDLTPQGKNRNQFLFGARMIDMKESLNWNFSGDISGLPLPGRSGVSRLDATNWDFVVGFKGFHFLGNDGPWFVPYYVDAGAGDSDFTWQGMLGVGRSFGWGEAILSWRVLDIDLKSGAPIRELQFSGPMVGASWAW